NIILNVKTNNHEKTISKPIVFIYSGRTVFDHLFSPLRAKSIDGHRPGRSTDRRTRDLRDAQWCGTSHRGTWNVYDPTACGDYGSEKLERKRAGRTDLYEPERKRNVAHDTGFGNRT